jgi:peroxiredoxin
MKLEERLHLLREKLEGRASAAGFIPPDALGIMHRATAEDDSWRLPVPARFVIDRDGTTRKVDVDPDYTVRPEPSETLAALDALARA